MKVLVLGAGSSYPAGFPLGGELQGQLRDFVHARQRRGGPYAPIISMWDALEELGVFQPADTFELNLSRVDIDHRRLFARARRGEEVDTLDPVTIASHMGKVFTDFFSERHRQIRRREGATAYLLRFLQRHVQPGDVLITFNYDTLLEEELKALGLWSLRTGYGLDLSEFYEGFESEDPSPCEVLKLHASVGWMTAFDRPGAGGFRQGMPGETFELVIDRERLGNFGHGDASLRDPNETRTVMLPMALPSFLKTLSRYPLPHLWRRAGASLQSAERVIVTGYSLPAADSAARALLLGVREGAPLDFYWCNERVDRIRGVESFFRQAGIAFRDRNASIESLADAELPLSHN